MMKPIAFWISSLGIGASALAFGFMLGAESAREKYAVAEFNRGRPIDLVLYGAQITFCAIGENGLPTTLYLGDSPATIQGGSNIEQSWDPQENPTLIFRKEHGLIFYADDKSNSYFDDGALGHIYDEHSQKIYITCMPSQEAYSP